MPLELSTIVLVTLRVTRFPHAEREEYIVGGLSSSASCR
jgi:hypothetical protein